MTIKCLDELEQTAVVEMYKDGYKQSDLAERWSVSRRTIQRVLIEAGELPPDGSRVLLSIDDRNMLETLHHHKITNKTLVKILHSPQFNAKNVIKVLATIEEPVFNSIFGAIQNARNQSKVADVSTH